MRKSKVKAKVAAGQPAWVMCLHFIDPSNHEMASLMGVDAIWMDMEHHGYSLETANHCMRAARVGTADILARPAKGEYMRMQRMLEAGATGILYPRCSNPQEAAEVVRWAKFHPLGERGFDGGNPDMPFCSMDMAEYIHMANEETFIAIQLEEQKAIDQAEEILAVDGVDFLFIGPADFTVLSGIAGQFDHPKVQAAVEKVAKAAKNTGKNWGMPAGTIQRFGELVDLGARLIAHGGDIITVKNFITDTQSKLAALGMSFDNQLAPGASAVAGRSYLEKA